jgi:hypothetical protein
MTGFAGIDCSGYPGDAVMRRLRTSTNLSWCAVYLAPAPSHHDTGWMAEVAGLRAMGWGIAFVYVGQQLSGPGSHLVNGPQGQADGAACAALMRHVAKPGDYAFLDREVAAPFTGAEADYVFGWASAMEAAGFGVGVYCSHVTAEAYAEGLADKGLSKPRIWAFKVSSTNYGDMPGAAFPTDDPAGCGYPEAFIWQCRDEAVLTDFGGLQVDCDTALTCDPSTP